MRVLVDTSVLLAYTFSRDKNHYVSSELLKKMAEETLIVPVPVLTELFYMTRVRVSYNRAIKIFAMTRTAFEIVNITEADMRRMQEIMEQYEDAAFDFTDTALMSLAERLNIKEICTFDRRDFSIFRPRHCDYLKIIP